MKFIDEMYEMYKAHLTGDEEDSYVIVTSLLSNSTRGELKKLTDGFSDREYTEMVTFYMLELFQRKVAQEEFYYEQFEVGKNKLH